jgi:hypothetical protein
MGEDGGDIQCSREGRGQKLALQFMLRYSLLKSELWRWQYEKRVRKTWVGGIVVQMDTDGRGTAGITTDGHKWTRRGKPQPKKRI